MLTLRYMRLNDIPEVLAIDKQSFSPAWSAQSYQYEVSQSAYSHMVVLEESFEESAALTWFQRVRSQVLGQVNGSTKSMTRRQIVGYGGLWHILDEAHISTIASHPDFRGRGYGEILLAGMVQRALTLKADYLVLEVRVSNITAQNLYHKYDFEVVGTKVNYYRNNNEDAYDMRIHLDNGYHERFQARLRALRERCPFIDLYSEAKPPSS